MTSRKPFSDRPLVSVPSSVLLAIGLVLALAAPASAQGDAEEDAYREAFVNGRKLFQDGDYAAARAEFERAYEIIPRPVLLFNIASTHRRAGERAAAVAMYRRYLEEAPADDEYRELAAQVITELEAELAAEVEPEAPAAEPAVSPTPVTMSTRDQPPSPGRTLRWSGIAVAAVGVVGLGWGAVEGFGARSDADELNSLPAGTPWTTELQDQYERGQAREKRATYLLVGGGVAAALGATLYVIGHQQKGDGADGVAIGPLLTPDAAGMTVGARF